MKYLLLPLFIILFLNSPAFAEAAPLTAEYQLVNLINQYRRQQKLAPLSIDRSASEVARQHSKEMQEENFFNLISPTRGNLSSQLAYARISGRSQHSFIAIDYTVSGLLKQIKTNSALLSEDVTHLAVGITIGEHPEYGQALWATIILLDYMAQIDSIPRTLEPNSSLAFKAKIMPGHLNPRVPITFPNGQVQTFYPTEKSKNIYSFRIPLSANQGRYTLEILVDKPNLGPKVATILPFYVGQPYPLKEELQPPLHQTKIFKNTQEASNYLFLQVNQERIKHGMTPLEIDPRLNYVAYKHSEDMAKRHFFAHTNPDGLDPNQRFNSQGGIGSVGENIASGTSIDAAHFHLMNSPGHRANVLHADFTHLGIGIYFYGQNFYITQLFQHKNQEINTQDFQQGLISWLNNLRIQHQLPALQEDQIMSKTAQEHSRTMAGADHLAYKVQNTDFATRYTNNGGAYAELNTLILRANSLNDAIAKLKKKENVLAGKDWTKIGIGILQADSRSKGEKIIWITVGIAKD